MNEKILLMHGEDPSGESLQSGLEDAGFQVSRLRNGITDIQEFDHFAADLVLFEIQLQDTIDLEILQRLGGDQSLPVIAILNHWTTDLAVEAFRHGAHDVVPSTIPIKELGARIHNLIRLFHAMADGRRSEIIYEDLRIELKSRKVYRDQELIKLTPKEFELIAYLTKRAGEVCERQGILQEVWGYDFETGTNVVDVYIRHLRKKIDRGHTHKLIHTIRGSGYMVH